MLAATHSIGGPLGGQRGRPGPVPAARTLRRRVAWLGVVGLLWTCAGSPVTLTGRGPVVREARPLAPGSADGVELRGALDLDVRVGGPPALFLEGHADLLAHIDVELRSGVLHVEVARGLRLVPPPRVAVELPALARIGLSGSGTGRVGGVAGEALRVELVGSGDLVLEGHVDRLDVELTGSGEVDAGRLVARTVRVDQQGSGRLTVHAVDRLEGRGLGSGDLTTVVPPAHVELRMQGSGELRQRD